MSRRLARSVKIQSARRCASPRSGTSSLSEHDTQYCAPSAAGANQLQAAYSVQFRQGAKPRLAADSAVHIARSVERKPTFLPHARHVSFSQNSFAVHESQR